MGKKKSKSGPRGGTTTRTPGGLVRKVAYLHQDEAEALRRAAFDERLTESAIIREALRARLGIED